MSTSNVPMPSFSAFLHDFGEVIKNHHMGSVSASGADYVGFINDAVKFMTLPESKAFLSTYGRNISLIYNTAQGIRYFGNEVFRPQDTVQTPEQRKEFWCKVGYYSLTFGLAGVETMKYMKEAVSASSLFSDQAPLSVFTSESLDSLGANLSVPTTMAFIGFNYLTAMTESGVVQNLSTLPTMAEKVMHASRFLSSGISLAKIGAAVTGFPAVSLGLGVTACTFGVIGFFASRQHTEDQRSPLIGVKQELLQLIDQMHAETLKSMKEKMRGEELDPSDTEELKEICNACKDRVRGSRTEGELDMAIFLTGTTLGSLKGRGAVSEEVALRFDAIANKASHCIEERNRAVAERKEKLQGHKEFLVYELAELDQALADLGGEAYEDAVDRYKRAEIHEMQARLQEESQQVEALLQQDPVEIVITSWMDKADQVTSPKNKAYIAEQVNACHSEADLIDVYSW